jgi:(E)-4-hydroxy-3-methylbut-2-enyl-diphosphate synthase
MVGKVGIGGNNPVRIQSMTTTDTMDTEATVAECIEMIEAGCELVRITAPGKREAENLRDIKESLLAKGYDVPLVADIHFTPVAAEVAARIVEKIRVNPGNYTDKKKFKTIEYTPETYQAEIDRIRKRFTPLVNICKEEGTAMRIGTNHGSLSDRILSKYGDTPEGMVESAMEFLRICKEMDYHNVILSMKASNTLVMVQAYRHLIVKMEAEGMNYPLHLGVTEAGDGEDGRIKSAVGIGTMLLDGIGDTVRVSLTEAPVHEMPVAKSIVEKTSGKVQNPAIAQFENSLPYDPFHFKRRDTYKVNRIGSGQVPVVVGAISELPELRTAAFFPFDFKYSIPLDKWNIGDFACDFVYTGAKHPDFELPGLLNTIVESGNWNSSQKGSYPIFSLSEFGQGGPVSNELNFVRVDASDIESFKKHAQDESIVWVLSTSNQNPVMDLRRWIVELMDCGSKQPVIAFKEYTFKDELTAQVELAAQYGSLLMDGLIDGLWVQEESGLQKEKLNKTLFGILQASRARISKTEYISCPSCGRTLFDLQETTAKIKASTAHLKGVKIGIMGCIVNGPGEMADADYGYVGTGIGKITLYKGQEVVKRNIPSEEAVQDLINLIKEYGDWTEPKPLMA